MTKNKLKPIDVSKYTVTDTGQVLKMNKEVEVIQRPTYAELEEKISILLSCNSCPDNKGGLLCQKEYEDKCLAQKIQYIKELQEENAELKKIEEEYYDFIQKKNEEDWKGDNVVGCLKLKIEQLKAQIEKMKCCGNCAKNGHICVAEEMQGKLCGKNKVKWQLRR